MIVDLEENWIVVDLLRKATTLYKEETGLRLLDQAEWPDYVDWLKDNYGVKFIWVDQKYGLINSVIIDDEYYVLLLLKFTT